jgi:hypothetical protein
MGETDTTVPSNALSLTNHDDAPRQSVCRSKSPDWPKEGRGACIVLLCTMVIRHRSAQQQVLVENPKVQRTPSRLDSSARGGTRGLHGLRPVSGLYVVLSLPNPIQRFPVHHLYTQILCTNTARMGREAI